jgi:DNA-directed RNA polymerase alpha subunit
VPDITFKDIPGRKHECSVRLIRICEDNRFRRLTDLSEMTYKEILRMPECGETTANYIKGLLNKYGLDFREVPKKNRKKGLKQISKSIKLLERTAKRGWVCGD